MFEAQLTTTADSLKKTMTSEKTLDLFEQVAVGSKAYAQLLKDLQSLDAFRKRATDYNSKGERPPLTPAYFTGFKGYADKIRKSANTIADEVGKTATRESNKNKKSATYRALKVYGADIELISTKVEQQYKFDLEKDNVDKMRASKQAGDIEGKLRSVLAGLRQVGTNMEVGIAQGTKRCKLTMANPTANTWNAINTDAGARKLSQALSNLIKYCYSDIDKLAPTLTETDKKVMSDPTLLEHVQELKFYLKKHEAALKELGKTAGSDAYDGTIGFLANMPAGNLPENATPEQVHKAVKHFSALMKEAAVIAADLKKFGY